MSSTGSVLDRPPAGPAATWAPRWFTRRRWPDSDGADHADFAETLLRVSKGYESGAPLVFRPWQRWLLDGIFERRPDGRLRYRRVLVGLARKNGKSLLGTEMALYGLVNSDGESAEVYSAAGDRQQARIVFGEARQQVLGSPALSSLCKVYRDAIEVPSTGSVYRVLSADAKLQQGLNPSLVLFDEVHVQPNDDLWDALTLGSGARRDPLVVGITTAGFDRESLLGRLYLYGQQVVEGKVDDEQFGFFWWEAPAGCRLDDRAAWAAANPNLAEGLLDEEDMAVSVKQTSEMAVRRFRLNQWTEAAESWLPAGSWEACRERPEGDGCVDFSRPFVAAVDMALRRDSAACVVAQVRPDGKVGVQAWIWTPEGGQALDVEAVEARVRWLQRTGQLEVCGYDPSWFVRSAQVLEDSGVPMEEFQQSPSRMVPACGQAYQLIADGRVAHDGDPLLARHVQAAVPRVSGEAWRLSKGKSARPIDGCVALVMAVDLATSVREEAFVPFRIR